MSMIPPTLIEPLESRTLLAGVTIITHGYNGNISGWVKTAADDIANRIGADDTSRYVMTVDRNSKGKLAVTSFIQDGGPGIENSVNAEAIIRLDWRNVSGGAFSTVDVGNVVADYLLNWHGSMRPLAGLPLHFIAHSRGASLMTVVAQRLGEKGIWVDQLTSLDPHPVDGHNDFAGISFGDAPMQTWDNITFADDYWRTDGDPNNFDFDGESVAGAHQGDLNQTVQQEFIGSAHMAVPAYYIGTIDLKTSNGGDHPVFADWYGTGKGQAPRDGTGYAFSRLGGTPRPVDGLRPEFGGTAPRVPTDIVGSQWGDVSDLQVVRGTTYTIGQKIPLRVKQQDRDGAYNVTLWLDRDKNPYNDNNVRKIRSLDFGTTSDVTPTRINGSSSGIQPGYYYVYARITDAAGHARYTYSRRIKLVAG